MSLFRGTGGSVTSTVGVPLTAELTVMMQTAMSSSPQVACNASFRVASGEFLGVTSKALPANASKQAPSESQSDSEVAAKEKTQIQNSETAATAITVGVAVAVATSGEHVHARLLVKMWSSGHHTRADFSVFPEPRLVPVCARMLSNASNMTSTFVIQDTKFLPKKTHTHTCIYIYTHAVAVAVGTAVGSAAGGSAGGGSSAPAGVVSLLGQAQFIGLAGAPVCVCVSVFVCMCVFVYVLSFCVLVCSLCMWVKS
jgi:hypothetical protein